MVQQTPLGVAEPHNSLFPATILSPFCARAWIPLEELEAARATWDKCAILRQMLCIAGIILNNDNNPQSLPWTVAVSMLRDGAIPASVLLKSGIFHLTQGKAEPAATWILLPKSVLCWCFGESTAGTGPRHKANLEDTGRETLNPNQLCRDGQSCKTPCEGEKGEPNLPVPVFISIEIPLDIALAAQGALGTGRIAEMSMCFKDSTFSPSAWDFSHGTNGFPLQKSAICLGWKCNRKHQCPKSCESHACTNPSEKHHF